MRERSAFPVVLYEFGNLSIYILELGQHVYNLSKSCWACPTECFASLLFMLCRWGVRVYCIGFVMAGLDYVLVLMGFRFGRPPRLYVKETRTPLRITVKWTYE